MKPIKLDPLNVNERLYRQLDRCLKRLEQDDETITTPQLINMMIAVGRIQIMFATLRKAENRDRDSAASGSEVRKFEQAFAIANASRRRAANAGPEPAYPEPDGELDDNPGFVPEDDQPANG